MKIYKLYKKYTNYKNIYKLYKKYTNYKLIYILNVLYKKYTNYVKNIQTIKNIYKL